MAGLIDRLRELINQQGPGKICGPEIAYVQPVDSPVLAELAAETAVVAPTGASTPTPLRGGGSFRVRSAVVRNGPRDDGTDNSNAMFIGGPGVDGAGFPLRVNESLAFDAVDLTKVFFWTQQPLDRARIVFVS